MTTPKSSRELLDVLIRAGLLVILAVFCYRVFAPFLDLMLWAVILAITLYPIYRWLSARIGNRGGWAATLLVLLAVLLMIVPVYLISASLVDSVHSLIATLKSGSLHVPPPSEKVARIPKLYDLWSRAATDLTALLQSLMPRMREASKHLLGMVAGLGVQMLVFIASIIIAGIVMAYGEQGTRASRRIASRLFGEERGPDVAALCTATVRTVAQGVVGIAFIQMLLVAVGFLVIGVPGAGFLAMVVLLLGIIQVPVSLITIPVIAFVFYRDGVSAGTIIFAVYVFAAGLSDNVLKPLLLGRGVDIPMPVILIGAIGGMVSNGIIGLFIGPVALAVGYRLFWEWVDAKVPKGDPVVIAAPPPPPG